MSLDDDLAKCAALQVTASPGDRVVIESTLLGRLLAEVLRLRQENANMERRLSATDGESLL